MWCTFVGGLWLLNQIPPFVKLQTYFLWLIHSNGSTISLQLLDCRLVISCTIGAQLVLGSNFAMSYSCPNLHFVSLKGKLCCKLLPAVVVKKPKNPDMHFHVRYSLFSLLDLLSKICHRSSATDTVLCVISETFHRFCLHFGFTFKSYI
jgi:hypothetical protein